MPLNESALPNLPAVDQVGIESVPLLPLPDWSAAIVPLPSSKPHAPTSAGARPARDDRGRLVRRGAGVAGVVARGDLVVVGAGDDADVRVARARRLADRLAAVGVKPGVGRAVDVVAARCRSRRSRRPKSARDLAGGATSQRGCAGRRRCRSAASTGGGTTRRTGRRSCRPGRAGSRRAARGSRSPAPGRSACRRPAVKLRNWKRWFWSNACVTDGERMSETFAICAAFGVETSKLVA